MTDYEQASLNFEVAEPDETQAPQPVTIHFLPDDIFVEAMPGDLLLQVAHKAGIDIPTGCLRGSCHACEVETDVWGPVCSCIAAVPPRSLTVELWQDPTW